MRIMAALEAKNHFGDLLNTAQREPVTIEKHGKPVAVMVSAAEYADIRAGRTVDGAAAFADLKDRLG